MAMPTDEPHAAPAPSARSKVPDPRADTPKIHGEASRASIWLPGLMGGWRRFPSSAAKTSTPAPCWSRSTTRRQLPRTSRRWPPRLSPRPARQHQCRHARGVDRGAQGGWVSLAQPVSGPMMSRRARSCSGQDCHRRKQKIELAQQQGKMRRQVFCAGLNERTEYGENGRGPVCRHPRRSRRQKNLRHRRRQPQRAHRRATPPGQDPMDSCPA
jgi:hypothetical protein